MTEEMNKCCPSENGVHKIVWDSQILFSDNLINIEGRCIQCRADFQKTYEEVGIVILNTHDNTFENYDYEVKELN